MSESIVKPSVKESSPVAPPKVPTGGNMTAQFVQVDMSAVKGGPTAGAKHAGAPDGGVGGANIPAAAGRPNQGHVPAGASLISSRGKSPKRGAGHKTVDADLPKLSKCEFGSSVPNSDNSIVPLAGLLSALRKASRSAAVNTP